MPGYVWHCWELWLGVSKNILQSLRCCVKSRSVCPLFIQGVLMRNVKLVQFSNPWSKVHSHLGRNEAVIVDLKLAKDVVDLGLGEFVSPRLEGMREHLCVDLPCLLSLALVGAECPDDQVVGVVGAFEDITGISRQIRSKLRDWAIWPVWAGRYSWAA